MFTLKEGKIIDEWSTMIEGCQGLFEELMHSIEQRIGAEEAPGIAMRRETVAPGWLKGLLGKRRDYLLVTSERFDEFLVCVGARDYGRNLDVSWYLTASPKFLKGITHRSAALGDIDVFDQQDLRAYTTVAHHAVVRSVEELMKQHNLDLSRLDRKSRGQLGIV